MPADGSQVCRGPVAFQWPAVDGALSYQVQLASEEGFATPILDTALTTPSLLYSTPLAPDTYYWRVAASNACGVGNWSSIYSLDLVECVYLPMVLRAH